VSFARRLRNYARRRLGLERALAPPLSAPSAVGAFEFDAVPGHIDSIDGAPLPILRVHGWHAGRVPLPFELSTDAGRIVSPHAFARSRRLDIVAAGLAVDNFCGFRVDFLLRRDEQPSRLTLAGREMGPVCGAGHFSRLEPHYGGFFTQAKVMGRNSIYGSGPPTDAAEEFKDFVIAAEGRVLDFGCGNGDVVACLRARGRDATGLELDEQRIRSALKPEVAAHVRLYDGSLPLPFDDASFDWVVSTEVIEHVPDIARYVGELARVLRPGGRLLVTTPDITSIPSSFPAGCVPWHLLEATHVNFFTPLSVVTLFAPCFDIDSLYCLGSNRVNGLFVPGSIGAIFVARPV
jgi:SAM-dependent methyltransferase